MSFFSILLILVAALAIGGSMTAFCFGLFGSRQDEAGCREDCSVCPDAGHCQIQESRSTDEMKHSA